MIEWFMEQVLLPLCAVAITGAIIAAADWFRRVSGITIEAKHREALHSALMTGIRMAISQFGPGANKATLTQAAVQYADKSVPDAMRKLNPSPDMLSSMAESKLVEAVSANAPRVEVATPVVVPPPDFRAR